MKGALGLLEAEFKIRISLQMIYGRSALKRKGIGKHGRARIKTMEEEETRDKLYLSSSFQIISKN